ncbi:MAG: GNAT family N-acetyltransferase, partial [Quinella sp. 1Q7]|nr:GNAT family N-acetyltransferase [Quinella sp. 1Q7]
MHETLTIRKAELKDAEELLSIYAPYVEKTAVTFEYEVPSLEEFQNRMKGIMERYPYLVAEKEGRIIGYAYTCRFHPRDAYQWCAETAIYLEMDQRHHGAGRALYRRLEDISVLQGIRNLNACIAYPEGEDPYLDLGSPLFHEKMG